MGLLWIWIEVSEPLRWLKWKIMQKCKILTFKCLEGFVVGDLPSNHSVSFCLPSLQLFPSQPSHLITTTQDNGLKKSIGDSSKRGWGNGNCNPHWCYEKSWGEYADSEKLFVSAWSRENFCLKLMFTGRSSRCSLLYKVKMCLPTVSISVCPGSDKHAWQVTFVQKTAF